MLSVALYQLGWSGNASGEHNASIQCGCGIGSLAAWMDCTVAGLLELDGEVVQFASKMERLSSQAWV